MKGLRARSAVPPASFDSRLLLSASNQTENQKLGVEGEKGLRWHPVKSHLERWLVSCFMKNVKKKSSERPWVFVSPKWEEYQALTLHIRVWNNKVWGKSQELEKSEVKWPWSAEPIFLSQNKLGWHSDYMKRYIQTFFKGDLSKTCHLRPLNKVKENNNFLDYW